MSAGYGSRGQGVGRVEVESSLTAAVSPSQKNSFRVWKAIISLGNSDLFTHILTCQSLTPAGTFPHTPTPREHLCGPLDLDPPSKRKQSLI